MARAEEMLCYLHLKLSTDDNPHALNSENLFLLVPPHVWKRVAMNAFHSSPSH